MELKELMTAFAETLGIEGIAVENGTCSLTIDDIPMEFTESPGGLAVVGAAVRDEEAAQFSRFGGNGPGFMSV